MLGHEADPGPPTLVQSNPAVAAAIGDLGRIVLAETSLDEVFKRIADVARRALPPAAMASLTVVGPHNFRNGAFSDPGALELDESQFELGYGPCINAAMGSQIVVIDDMRDEPRFAEFAEAALKLGVLSSASAPLPIQEDFVAGLNVYAHEPQAFGPDELEVLQTVASYAAVAVANARGYADAAALARQMQEAMEFRAVIEQAKGIIMGERRCTADEAFTILSKLSQDTNRKLRDVAAALVDSAQQSRPS